MPFSKYTPGKDKAPGDESLILDYPGVGTVQWVGKGGAPIYDSPFDDQKLTGKSLKNGTYWKVYKYVETGGAKSHEWFNLGGNQWIDGNYITFDKSGGFVSNKVIGIGTIKTVSRICDPSLILTVPARFSTLGKAELRFGIHLSIRNQRLVNT